MNPEELEAKKRALTRIIGQGGDATSGDSNESTQLSDTLSKHLSGKTREAILAELLKNR
jgi:hypothetical protein